MFEEFNIAEPPCEWCGGKVKIVRLPYDDERIYVSLFLCLDCGMVQMWIAAFKEDFPMNEAIKIRDELTEKYGA